MHREQQANVGTISDQSNGCKSSEKTIFTSFDIDMVIQTTKAQEKNPIIGYLNIIS